MRNSLKKLGGLALPKHEKRDRQQQQSSSSSSVLKLDELSQASQDMQDMKDCYDSLLAAAAATANSAYEFSESLREIGECLLEKTALNDDEESGTVLLMLGKVQFVIQNLVDCYRSHISKTITIPSESLLNELRIVEHIHDVLCKSLYGSVENQDQEMKKQCDEKRRVFEDMMPKYRGKGRMKRNKGEFVSARELQAALDEFDEGASMFVFRMKSLKKGQSRSLLTQAARHHAAQVSFFRKALKSLEAIEPQVKFVTEQQHIAYHFDGLDDEDDEEDEEDDEDNSKDDDSEACDDNELSFEYGQGQDICASRDSMEEDKVNVTFSKVSAVDAMKEYSYKNHSRKSFVFGRDLDASSKSAPILVGKDSDSGERFIPTLHSSSRKFYTYVLPTPDETKIPASLRSDTKLPQTRRASMSGGTLNPWHSSPLEHKRNAQLIGNEKLSGSIFSNSHSVLKESNINTTPSRLARPMTDDLSSLLDQHGDAKKIKRQAFSGPLTGKTWSNKPSLSVSGPIGSTGNSLLFSGSLPPKSSSSPILLSSVLPTFTSSPKISELHELPRPPWRLASKGPQNVHHSSPLMPNVQELSATHKLMPTLTSALPLPPQSIHCSYSIPSRSQITTELHMDNTLETQTPQNFMTAEDITSPHLTPVSLSNN